MELIIKERENLEKVNGQGGLNKTQVSKRKVWKMTSLERMTLERKSLKKDSFGKEHSETKQFWQGNIWTITILKWKNWKMSILKSNSDKKNKKI